MSLIELLFEISGLYSFVILDYFLKTFPNFMSGSIWFHDSSQQIRLYRVVDPLFDGDIKLFPGRFIDISRTRIF